MTTSSAPGLEGLVEIFFGGTGPAWSILAVFLLAAASYIRFLDDDDYPVWTWRLYYLLFMLVLATRASPHYIDHESILMVLEVLLLASTGFGAAALFYYIINSAETPTLREIVHFVVSLIYEWRARKREPKSEVDD